MIAECLLIKNENRYLHEHIINNVRAGIDFFYIYDNNSDEPVKQFLQKNVPKTGETGGFQRLPMMRIGMRWNISWKIFGKKRNTKLGMMPSVA